MSNTDTPVPDNPPPSPSNGDKQRNKTVKLGIKDWVVYEGPLNILGAIVVTLFLTFFLAYLATLWWVIPKRVVIFSGPLIEAVLTAQPTPTTQPPLPRLVVAKKVYPNSLYCVVNGEKVNVRIEPPPDTSTIQYLWMPQGVEELTEVRDNLEKEFTVVGKKLGDGITVTLYQADVSGRFDRPISDVRFLVQEVCPR